MKPIVELLRNRPQDVYKIAPDVTVFDGLKLLSDYGVGAILVICLLYTSPSPRD